MIDRLNLTGTLNLIGSLESGDLDIAEGSKILAERDVHPQLSADPEIPDDTRLWAALQTASGGTWGGCVYDVDAILKRLAR